MRDGQGQLKPVLTHLGMLEGISPAGPQSRSIPAHYSGRLAAGKDAPLEAF